MTVNVRNIALYTTVVHYICTPSQYGIVNPLSVATLHVLYYSGNTVFHPCIDNSLDNKCLTKTYERFISSFVRKKYRITHTRQILYTSDTKYFFLFCISDGYVSYFVKKKYYLSLHYFQGVIQTFIYGS